MDTSARSDGLREPGHVEGGRGAPGVDAVPEEPRPNERTPARIPAGADIPNGGGFDTFIGGAGI
jgi:hypothetical protein